VLRVLDLGAIGIVVPHVDSAAQAEDAVRAAHYPPRGDRGFATYTRAGRFGLTGVDEHLAAAAERTVVIAMIESRAGVAAAGEIADVDGVDAVFVGPADLALDLGHPGEPRHPEVAAAIADVGAAVRRRCALMAIVADAAGATAAAERGATIVVHNVQAALDALFLGFAQTPARPGP
jgi:2-keto-3-deoxy-L-rhamnonate aldolase RhmA